MANQKVSAYRYFWLAENYLIADKCSNPIGWHFTFFNFNFSLFTFILLLNKKRLKNHGSEKSRCFWILEFCYGLAEEKWPQHESSGSYHKSRSDLGGKEIKNGHMMTWRFLKLWCETCFWRKKRSVRNLKLNFLFREWHRMKRRSGTIMQDKDHIPKRVEYRKSSRHKVCHFPKLTGSWIKLNQQRNRWNKRSEISWQIRNVMVSLLLDSISN